MLIETEEPRQVARLSALSFQQVSIDYMPIDYWVELISNYFTIARLSRRSGEAVPLISGSFLRLGPHQFTEDWHARLSIAEIPAYRHDKPACILYRWSVADASNGHHASHVLPPASCIYYTACCRRRNLPPSLIKVLFHYIAGIHGF